MIRALPTLEQIVRDYSLSAIDLLLIDVEGAELPALKGFPWSELPLPRIFCELHPYAWPDFGYSGTDFQHFLSSRQLRCIDMYMTEHVSFTQPDYIGPTVLIK